MSCLPASLRCVSAPLRQRRRPDYEPAPAQRRRRAGFRGEDRPQNVPPLLLRRGPPLDCAGGVIGRQWQAGPLQPGGRVQLQQRHGQLPHAQLRMRQELDQLRRPRRPAAAPAAALRSARPHAVSRASSSALTPQQAAKLRQPRVAGRQLQQRAHAGQPHEQRGGR